MVHCLLALPGNAILTQICEQKAEWWQICGTQNKSHICFNCLGFYCGKMIQKCTPKNPSINSFLPITRDQWKTTPNKQERHWNLVLRAWTLWSKPQFGSASWFYYCLTSTTLSKLLPALRLSFPTLKARLPSSEDGPKCSIGESTGPGNAVFNIRRKGLQNFSLTKILRQEEASFTVEP